MSEKAVVVINFPVKNHVYKYLQSKVGEKLIVTNTGFLGTTVLDILSKNYSDQLIYATSVTFPVEISWRYLEKAGLYLNSKGIAKFNARVDDLFREEIRSFVGINHRKNRIPKERSLRNFLDDYNISEDDIKFETLLKDVQRNIKKA